MNIEYSIINIKANSKQLVDCTQTTLNLKLYTFNLRARLFLSPKKVFQYARQTAQGSVEQLFLPSSESQ